MDEHECLFILFLGSQQQHQKVERVDVVTAVHQRHLYTLHGFMDLSAEYRNLVQLHKLPTPKHHLYRLHGLIDLCIQYTNFVQLQTSHTKTSLVQTAWLHGSVRTVHKLCTTTQTSHTKTPLVHTAWLHGSVRRVHKPCTTTQTSHTKTPLVHTA